MLVFDFLASSASNSLRNEDSSRLIEFRGVVPLDRVVFRGVDDIVIISGPTNRESESVSSEIWSNTIMGAGEGVSTLVGVVKL